MRFRLKSGRLRAFARLAVAGPILALGIVAAGSQGAAIREYATIDDHDPSGFAYALRYGADLVKRDAGASFTLILGGRAVLLVVPGTNVAQRDYDQLRQGAGARLQIIACGETVTLLQQNFGQRIPVLPGVTVAPCNGRVNEMRSQGWQPMIGM